MDEELVQQADPGTPIGGSLAFHRPHLRQNAMPVGHVLPVVGRLFEFLLPYGGSLAGHRRIGVVQLGIDVGKVATRHVKERERLLRRPKVDHASLREETDVVALDNVGRGVGHQEDRAASIGQAAQGVHHLFLQARVQPRGGLVEEEEVRLG